MALTPLTGVDLVFLALSLGLTVTIGMYYKWNKSKSAKDTYTITDKQPPLAPRLISILTSCTSMLNLLGTSSELFYQGPSYSFVFIGHLLSGPIIAYTILPIFYRMNDASVFQYLGKRYGLIIKYIALIIFIFQVIIASSVVVYLPSLAIQMLFNIHRQYSIAIISVTFILYSGFFSLKVNVWTDFIQAIIFYSIIITVACLGINEVGGISLVFDNALNGGRLDLDGFFKEFNYLTTRHTWFGVVIGSTLNNIYRFGINQANLQRANSLPSLRWGQYSFISYSLFSAATSLLFTFVGLVIYSSYRSCDPYLANHTILRRDALYLHYQDTRLLHRSFSGLRGLFFGGIFSVALSILSSSAHSISSLGIEHFVKPMSCRISSLANLNLIGVCDERKSNQKDKDKRTDQSGEMFSKLFSITFGILVMTMAYVIDKSNSRLLQLATTVIGATGIPLLGALILGIYTRFTNTVGLVSAFLVTIPFGVYIIINQSFNKSALKPTQIVYYDQNCAGIFNMSMSSNTLSQMEQSVLGGFNHLQIPPEQEYDLQLVDFGNTSYMTLPIIQLVVTIVVACFVSVLTGGWRQEVNETCLAISKFNTEETKKAGESK